MNILVLNGSPKGKNSITLQTVLYLEKLHPEHTFEILHVGQRIKALEKDFTPAAEALERAELLLFSYPVYTFLAPSQLHRFIELVKASGLTLAGKFASQITTSKHFYDVTAHRYIEENCFDLGLQVIRGLSADMDDLLTEKGQQDAAAFFDRMLWCVEHSIVEPAPPPAKPAARRYVALGEALPDKSGDVVIVTDCADDDLQLMRMIRRFQNVSSKKTRIVNIRLYPFAGGCLGCYHCAADGTCVYKDGFDEFLRNSIQKAEAIVFAFTIRDHSMGADFKRYDDRQFCNGHRTVTMGMPMGYLISGNYSDEANLRMVIEGHTEVGGSFLAGVATDEIDPNTAIDTLAASLTYAIDRHYTQPKNFLGVGGMKIFRDLIWVMQGMMKADHRFYKEHGQYDFPQKQKGTICKMYVVGTLLSSPKVQKKTGSNMTEEMLSPYKKVFKKLDQKEKKA